MTLEASERRHIATLARKVASLEAAMRRLSRSSRTPQTDEPDPAPAAYRIGPVLVQTGNTVVTTNSSGQATVPFPIGYSDAPVVTSVMGNAHQCSIPTAPTATGFPITVTTPAGVTVASTAVRVYWSATGAA